MISFASEWSYRKNARPIKRMSNKTHASSGRRSCACSCAGDTRSSRSGCRARRRDAAGSCGALGMYDAPPLGLAVPDVVGATPLVLPDGYAEVVVPPTEELGAAEEDAPALVICLRSSGLACADITAKKATSAAKRTLMLKRAIVSTRLVSVGRGGE